VYLTGENLFTFTKYSGYDPEIGGGVMGIDRGFILRQKHLCWELIYNSNKKVKS